jgi:hypothetical protein
MNLDDPGALDCLAGLCCANKLCTECLAFNVICIGMIFDYWTTVPKFGIQSGG